MCVSHGSERGNYYVSASFVETLKTILLFWGLCKMGLPVSIGLLLASSWLIWEIVGKVIDMSEMNCKVKLFMSWWGRNGQCDCSISWVFIQFYDAQPERLKKDWAVITGPRKSCSFLTLLGLFTRWGFMERLPHTLVAMIIHYVILSGQYVCMLAKQLSRQVIVLCRYLPGA